MIELITVSDFVYTSGQGGTPYYPADFSVVDAAFAVNVAPVANGVADVPFVTAVGIAAGTIAGSAPAPNEVLISIYSNTASLTEIASGTISKITLVISGY